MAEVTVSTHLAQLGSGRTAPLLMPYLINVTVIVGISEQIRSEARYTLEASHWADFDMATNGGNGAGQSLPA